MNICDTFQNLARQTWINLEYGRNAGHQLLEETITDINLLHLKLQHPEVITVSFNKSEEGKNGADWEWWFYDFSGNWVGFRIQAKVLDFRTRGFNQLYYHKDKSSLSQCDKLIVNAKLDPKHPRLPFYVLYLEDDILPDLTVHPTVTDIRTFGCSVVSAYQIKDLKSTKTTNLSDWDAELLPWKNLVCDSRERPFMDVSTMLEVIKERFGFQDIKGGTDYLQSSPPPYVLQIMNSDGNYSNLEGRVPNLAGVTIVRIGEDDQDE